MKVFGIILIVLGVVSLVYGGITYNREKTVVDIGPIEATATERERIPLPPIVGGVALVAGVLMLVVPRRSAA
jgi:uncharacterized membrane protein HdeD (DUF308 family)